MFVNVAGNRYYRLTRGAEKHTFRMEVLSVTRRKKILFVLLYIGIVLAILFADLFIKDRFGHKALRCVPAPVIASACNTGPALLCSLQ